MNENTELLLRELGSKLGTTTDHLWGVLVQQAPLSGVVSLTLMTLWVSFMVWAFRYIKRNTTITAERDENSAFAWGAWLASAGASGVIIGASLNTTIAAIFNPEYWALLHILKFVN
jgi:hypothetical protein